MKDGLMLECNHLRIKGTRAYYDKHNFLRYIDLNNIKAIDEDDPHKERHQLYKTYASRKDIRS